MSKTKELWFITDAQAEKMKRRKEFTLAHLMAMVQELDRMSYTELLGLSERLRHFYNQAEQEITQQFIALTEALLLVKEKEDVR
jgi:hypothetical protein